MVGFFDDADHVERIREVVRGELALCEAMSPQSLMLASGMKWEVLSGEIDALERAGEIEALRPLFVGSLLNPKRLPPRSSVHYRLIRPTDSDFLWEQDVNGHFPSGRTSRSFPIEGPPRQLQYSSRGKR